MGTKSHFYCQARTFREKAGLPIKELVQESHIKSLFYLLKQTKTKRIPFTGILFVLIGGGNRDRTDDLQIANLSLSQLSYTPTAQKPNAAKLLQTPNYVKSLFVSLIFNPRCFTRFFCIQIIALLQKRIDNINRVFAL